MEPVPDAWPPDESAAAEGPVVPMFPLRGVFLYPGLIMPLHIFEPRYREMIEDVLDGPGRIVMGTILEGEDETGNPSVLPIAGVGEIDRHYRLPDGGFNILLVGLARARLTEVDSDRLYRRVRIERLHETKPTPEADERVNTLLRAAVMEREAAVTAHEEDPPKLPEELPTALLVDLLSQRLSTTQSVLERIFSEAEIERRAELALDAHARFPADG